MSNIRAILADPYKRTASTYRFKVTCIEGNTIHYHDVTKVTHTQELPNDSEYTLEEQYADQMDNLFVAITISGEYYFTSKLSNHKPWPGFSD